MRFFKTYLLFLLLLNSNLTLAKNYFYKNVDIEADKYFLIEQDDSIQSLTIEARLSVLKNKERVGYSNSKWRIVWNYVSSLDYDFVELTWQNTSYGDIYDKRQAVVFVGTVRSGAEKIISSKKINKGVNLSTGANSILVEISKSEFNLFVGDDKLSYVGTYKIDNLHGSFCGIVSSEDANMYNLIIESTPDVAKELSTTFTIESLKDRYILTNNLNEGFWSYLDRDVNLEWARIGGKYRLALVENGGEYLIIYIDGADTNKSKWVEGMIKGILKPTIFKNHYDLVWYDSTFDIIDSEANAVIENSILTLNFPLYKSSIRFYKERL